MGDRNHGGVGVKIDPIDITLDGFEEVEPGYWLGSAYPFGVLHHAELIRVIEVRDGDDIEIVEWEPPTGEGDNLNDIRLERYLATDPDVLPHRIRVPGLPGMYVLYITPGGE
jgi:hypothetical protein